MDEKYDDESADAESNVDIYGSAVDFNEFFAALGVEKGYPDCDQISLLRESGNVSKGKNFFLQYQFVIILLSRSHQETLL